MKYFKVNPSSDQVRHGKNFLIRNELYTEKELDRFNLPKSFVSANFTEVEISKRKTAFLFGARFSSLFPYSSN